MSLPHTPTSSSCVVRKEYAIGRWMQLMFLSPYPLSMLTPGVGKGLWSPCSPCFCPETSKYGVKPRQKHVGPTSICPPLNHGGDSLLRHWTLKWHSSRKVSGMKWGNNRIHNLNKKRKLQIYHQKQTEYTYIYLCIFSIHSHDSFCKILNDLR